MIQTPAERQALNAAFEALPAVAEFKAALKAHAIEHNLGFDVAGMNAVMAFAARHRREHGQLPPSGIIAG